MNETENEIYLSGRVEEQEAQISRLKEYLTNARETVEMLEQVIHKAAQIAQHLPYLCSTLTEPSLEIEQAALQLQTLLLQRKV